ncbi:unnamed protein product [Arctia plantaginis]|uniref:Uncharacterized protein n=1 Tax=Arctia plantaginis TaxID=874455 RepID=A0A8S0YXD8_ARCPL|nr:unnamed protein product [Arctia plantaginis]
MGKTKPAAQSGNSSKDSKESHLDDNLKSEIKRIIIEELRGLLRQEFDSTNKKLDEIGDGMNFISQQYDTIKESVDESLEKIKLLIEEKEVLQTTITQLTTKIRMME